MTLGELLQKVKEQNLTKTELEQYRDELARLFAELQLEMSDLEKDEAIFMSERADGETAISRRITWKATQGGLRLITLKRYASATKTMMTSLRDRLYNFY